MSAFAGTRPLTRLALRRDRLMVPAWVLTFVVVAGVSASATAGLYPTVASRVQAGNILNSATAMVAMYGRIYDVTSLGAVALIKLSGFGAAMVALLAGMLVVRHTRADEEVGRYELAAAGVVGRYAALTSALVVAGATVLALSIGATLAFAAAGLPWSGSLAFGASWAGAGLVFAGVAAVTAQMATTARAARGLTASVLAGAYVVRAVGDTAAADGPRWLSWLSPIGWSQQVRPYAGDRWWVLALSLAATGALVLGAAALLARRDLGGGLLTDRPGPRTAGPLLGSPLALAWRLQRGALLGWTTGFVITGLLLGGIATSVEGLLDNPLVNRFLSRLGGAGALTDIFLATELGFAAIAAAAFGISAVLRLHVEEAQGRVDSLLTTGTSRTQWALAHVLVALVGTATLMVAVGLGMGVTYAVQIDDPGQVPRMLAAALARLPAVWVLTGVAVAFYGLSRHLAALGWVALVGCIVLGEFGPVMDLPTWTWDLSPFTHVPTLPGGEVQAAPLLWLTLVAAGLVTLGLARLRVRDLLPD
jgi:ABC-2 type transport system permease protein